MAYPGASMEDGEGVLAEGDVASAVALMVTERISALMDQTFSELHSTLDRMSSRIEDNTKRITETESRISEGVDRTASLECTVTELVQKVKILTERAEDSENRSRRDNIRVIGLKEAEPRHVVARKTGAQSNTEDKRRKTGKGWRGGHRCRQVTAQIIEELHRTWNRATYCGSALDRSQLSEALCHTTRTHTAQQLSLQHWALQREEGIKREEEGETGGETGRERGMQSKGERRGQRRASSFPSPSAPSLLLAPSPLHPSVLASRLCRYMPYPEEDAEVPCGQESQAIHHVEILDEAARLGSPPPVLVWRQKKLQSLILTFKNGTDILKPSIFIAILIAFFNLLPLQHDPSGPAGAALSPLQLEEPTLHSYLQHCDLEMNGKVNPTAEKITDSKSANMVSNLSPEGQPYTRASRTPRSSLRTAATFGKRSNSMRRNPKAEVSKQGWLYKQSDGAPPSTALLHIALDPSVCVCVCEAVTVGAESVLGGELLGLLSHVWTVNTPPLSALVVAVLWMVFLFLSFFLGWFLTLIFPSTDENEDTVLGSLPLLSFRVGGVEPSDNITRRFAFKVSNILVEGQRVLGGSCKQSSVETELCVRLNKDETMRIRGAPSGCLRGGAEPLWCCPSMPSCKLSADSCPTAHRQPLRNSLTGSDPDSLQRPVTFNTTTLNMSSLCPLPPTSVRPCEFCWPSLCPVVVRCEREDGEEGELKDPVVFCMQAGHAGTRTYYFSADSHEDQEQWIRAMSQAAAVPSEPSQRINPTVDPNHTMVTKAPNTQTHNDTVSDPPPHPKANGVNSLETPPPSTPCSDQEGKNNNGRQGEGEDGGGEQVRTPPLIQDRIQMDGATTALGTANPLYPGVQWTSCPQGHPEGGGCPPQDSREQQENVVLRRGFVPRTAPERVAQRKSSMAQLQHWVNQRRGMASEEDLNSPSHYYAVNQGLLGDFYGYPGGPQYMEERPLYPPGVRPDSICSVSAMGGYDPRWTVEEKRHSLRDVPHQLYGAPMQRDQWGPAYFSGMEKSMRRLSVQPRSRSVPRSPSSSCGGPYSPVPHSFASPGRSPSARFDRLPARLRDDVIYADPSVYSLRRSLSSPKYDYPGERRSLSQGLYHYNYPVSPSIHNKMEDMLDLQLQRNLDYLDQQVPPFHDVYSRELYPTLKLNEIETSKLLGRLCEQNRILKDHEAVVHRLRMDKDSLEEALVGTRQEMELYHNQPLAMEKLHYKKDTLQNQLINIRGELSQASSALTTTRMEFEALEDEANAIHGDLWEQLNAGGQSELVRRHIQKEFWRVQDVLEGLHKNNSSRGTDTAKHRVASGASGSFSTNSPASPLSSVSITSPLSPFSPVPGSQASPTKQLGPELISDMQDQDRQSTMNKVGIVPPRTKSPTAESHSRSAAVSWRVHNGISRERPKSAVFPAELKSKMSVEEQNERIRRNQSSSVRDKRRSLILSGGQSPANYKVEIARLRQVKGEAQPYHLDISRELLTPDKVLIPERYLDVEDSPPLSPEEQREKQKKLERIKTLIAKSNLQNMVPLLDGPVEGGAGSSQQQLQEQEKRIEISCALAAEASRRSRLLSAQCAPSPPTSPTSLAQPPSSADFPNSAHTMKA
ncbi:hypothetical protein F7725_017614 [Dissostichus mawsoni]|uniref:PH domain-containing protein n=1 Tax=Dissostichus mawsoni TaxID=36200 RepID=A0A7J5Z6U2_DISMA|nr:hypothetical protein F7725_017614 [Dissostichus mawsoni]